MLPSPCLPSSLDTQRVLAFDAGHRARAGCVADLHRPWGAVLARAVRKAGAADIRALLFMRRKRCRVNMSLGGRTSAAASPHLEPVFQRRLAERREPVVTPSAAEGAFGGQSCAKMRFTLPFVAPARQSRAGSQSEAPTETAAPRGGMAVTCMLLTVFVSCAAHPDSASRASGSTVGLLGRIVAGCGPFSSAG